MARSLLLLLTVYLLTAFATGQKDCLPESCPGPDCPPRDQCQFYVDLHGEPYYLQHATNCSRFWECEPNDHNGVNICLFECAPCAKWPEVTDWCPSHALFFDPTIKYPLGPVCNWPAYINCTNKACPLPCQLPDDHGVCHPECCVDADCRGDKPLCDENTHTCVPGCRLDQDCQNWDGVCPKCQWCDKPNNADVGKCEPGCLTDDQCLEPTPVCDTNSHTCKPIPCPYPCCKKDSDCHGYNTICEVPPWNSDPSCEYCSNSDNGQIEGTCTPGCIDTHDKCPDSYICDGHHQCNADCVYPCCRKSTDCHDYDTTCQLPALNPPNSPSCEYCTALDDGTAKGKCKPGCLNEPNMCPNQMDCAGNHECVHEGDNIIKKIMVKTKSCHGCSGDADNEGGAVLEVIGKTQCQIHTPPCVCKTNGLDHEGIRDYAAGNLATFQSGTQADSEPMGRCYQAIMRTSNMTISWSGPDGSTWSPDAVTIEQSGYIQFTCTPPQGTSLTNKDAPIVVNCFEKP